MPRAALELGAAEHVMSLGDIAPFLVQTARGGIHSSPPASAAPVKAAPAPMASAAREPTPGLAREKKTVLVQTLRSHGLGTVPICLWSGLDEGTGPDASGARSE